MNVAQFVYALDDYAGMAFEGRDREKEREALIAAYNHLTTQLATAKQETSAYKQLLRQWVRWHDSKIAYLPIDESRRAVGCQYCDGTGKVRSAQTGLLIPCDCCHVHDFQPVPAKGGKVSVCDCGQYTIE